MNKKKVLGTFGVHGQWHFSCRDASGKIKWEYNIPNVVTAEGLDHILNTEFHNTANVPTWYIGLKHPGTVSANDTLASHANWTECANYTGNRKVFVEDGASSGSISNANNKASFSINANNQTISGGFLCSAETGTSGVLFSTVDFLGGNKLCDNGDTLDVTYSITANSV